MFAKLETGIRKKEQKLVELIEKRQVAQQATLKKTEKANILQQKMIGQDSKFQKQFGSQIKEFSPTGKIEGHPQYSSVQDGDKDEDNSGIFGRQMLVNHDGSTVTFNNSFAENLDYARLTEVDWL